MTTIAQATDQQKAEQERREAARAVVERYRQNLYELLPSHLAGIEAAWMRSAFAAIRKNPKLIDAVNEDPDSVIDALGEAARLGLTPGSDQYYLTPRRRKVNGKYIASMLGVVGYQGEVELIFNAGAVSSVICDVVYDRDIFIWRPGALDREIPARWEGPQRQPYHEATDWFGDRGEVRGAYSYCIMKDGAVSKVVIVDQRRIKRAMDMAQDSSGEHSPWQTDYPAMVLKTAAHDQAKWVPTSAERQYQPERPRAVVNVDRMEHRAAEPNRVITQSRGELPAGSPSEPVDIIGSPPEPPRDDLVAQAAATQEAAKPAGEISATWRDAIAECVTNADQAGFMDLWESAKLTERDNDALAGALRVAGAQIKANLAETEAAVPEPGEPEPEGRRAIEKHLFALLGEGGIRDGDEDGRGKRLRILSRLTNRVPVLTSSMALTDIELAQVRNVLMRYQREDRLVEELEALGRVSEA